MADCTAQIHSHANRKDGKNESHFVKIPSRSVILFLPLFCRLFVHKCLSLTLCLLFFHPSPCLSVRPEASSHAALLTLIEMSDDVLWPLTLQLHGLSYFFNHVARRF